MDLGLSEKVAFVAGASRGIGLAIAKAFLGEGARVVITGRNAKALADASAALLPESDSKRLLSIQSDLTDPKDIGRAIEETVSAFGELDAVVANVGSGTARTGWELDLQDWESVFKTNLTGSMVLASA